MNVRPQFLFLGVAMVTILALADAYLTPPGEHWYEIARKESRTVDHGAVVKGGDDPAAVRSAAQAQWDLAEWHFGRGEWDDAEREYRRLMSEFPYVELDYGYRTDDARYRLDEVARLRRGEKVRPFEAGPPRK